MNKLTSTLGLAACLALSPLAFADTFDCSTGTGNCTGTIITSTGVTVPVTAPDGGFIRVASGHTFVAGSEGTWTLRQDP